MAKNEIVTDLWVHDLLNQAEIHLDAQGSNIRELDEALKSASKRGTGGIGYPEYCGIVDGFVIVIEDKANIQQHIAEDNGIILDDIKSICDYAVNGALHYGKHIAKNTTYKKIICIGVSGDEKHHRITPVFVDDPSIIAYYRMLKVSSLSVLLTSKNTIFARCSKKIPIRKKSLPIFLKMLHLYMKIYVTMATCKINKNRL